MHYNVLRSNAFCFDWAGTQFLFTLKVTMGNAKETKNHHVIRIKTRQKAELCDQMYRVHYQFCPFIFLRKNIQ